MFYYCMDRPLYLIDVDDNIDGVSAIALVNNPAMRTQMLAFSEDKEVEIMLYDTDKQIIATPIINVDMKVSRFDKKTGEIYDIVFSKLAAEKIAYKYMADKRQNSWNIEHDKRNKTNAITLVESYIVDRSMGKGVPEQHSFVKDGSWYGFAKVNDPEIWADIKSGKYKGVSLEGVMYEVPYKEDIIDEIANLLNKIS